LRDCRIAGRYTRMLLIVLMEGWGAVRATRHCLVILTVALAAGLAASSALAQRADTLKLDGKTYRLDGIDAPELDQNCFNEKGELFACGRASAQALEKFIAGRQVLCDDHGPDPAYKKGRIGQCSVDGTDLQRWLVRAGWALDFERSAKGHFRIDQDDARARQFGLWNGCFVAPRDFRRWNNRRAKLLGPDCPPDAREKLFPSQATMPAGCEIKGQYTRRAVPYRGIYHLPGCSSYQRTKARRWFCSEEEALAGGFRKAFTCDRR